MRRNKLKKTVQGGWFGWRTVVWLKSSYKNFLTQRINLLWGSLVVKCSALKIGDQEVCGSTLGTIKFSFDLICLCILQINYVTRLVTSWSWKENRKRSGCIAFRNAILKWRLPDESDWFHGCQMILALCLLMLF